MPGKVGILGAGQMGNGITQVVASVGLPVRMVDISQAALDKGLATINSSIDRLIKKELATAADKTKWLGLIETSTSVGDFKDCDFVVEAVAENIDLKLKIFKELDQVCPAGAILCSNTSSISITKIAAATKRPDKVAGMHFMNPVPLMKLVEGIRGLQTSDDTFTQVEGFAEKLGKTFVEVKDMPGFAVN